MSPLRRKSTEEQAKRETNPDRISELHEPLLLKIISLLDTKDAVKTGIFSKRWKNLWTHMDNLVFDYDGDISSRPSPELFIAFVDYVLMRCNNHNLKKFAIHLCLRDFGFDEKRARNKVSEWIESVLKKKVECVKLEISDFMYRAPRCFYHNSSLVNLEIGGGMVMIRSRGGSVNWASLKSLTMSHVSVRDDRMKRILSGCPVLENLVLDEVDSLTNLHIESPSVRKLKVVPCSDDSSLNIYAPWIQELEISGWIRNNCLKLIDVSSLVNAKLLRTDNQLSTERSLGLKEAAALLNSLHHIDELALGPEFSQDIEFFIVQTDDTSPFLPLFKWKRLIVQLPVKKYELPGLVCLLQRLPDLETLIVEVENFSQNQNELEKYFADMCGSDGIHECDEQDIYPILQTWDFPNLMTVEVARCRNACYREDILRKTERCRLYEFVAYLLSNAHALKKIFVTSQKEKCRICSTYCQFQIASMLSQKIQANHEFAEDWELKEKYSLFEFRHCGSNSKPSSSV